MSSSNSGPPSVSTGITVDLLKLVEDFPNYEDPDRVRSDVLELSKHCKTLVPRRGSVGASELLTLHGTFPIYFKGVAYQTPVQIYIKEDYPASAPLCYIVPALGMSLRVGHHSVDQRGVVTLPYLKEWSAGSHNLVGLVESLTAVFGAEPPLFATPGYQAPPPAKTLQGGKVQVVCPSYGRTGTSSMKAALEILGFGPAYHMQSVFANGGVHAQLWLDGFQGRGLDVDKVLEGYKAVTDWPAADLYKEILAANPDAKVVVTQRDPDSWWKSMATTISFENKTYGSWGFFFLQVLDSNFRLINSMLLHIKTLSMGEEEAKADYARHNKEVLEHVASDKLLEFSVKQGWEPLCEFLGVPVPDAPFPRANSTDEAQAKFKKASRGGWVMMTVALGVAGASVAAATFFGGKRAGGALAATEVVFLTHRVRKAVVTRRGG